MTTPRTEDTRPVGKPAIPGGTRIQRPRCYCPGDCNCRFQNAPWHRFNYCGCRNHNVDERI